MREFLLYFFKIPKRHNGQPVRINIKIMHFMNRIAILVFLIALTYWILK